jgi:hypothetical protein
MMPVRTLRVVPVVKQPVPMRDGSRLTREALPACGYYTVLDDVWARRRIAFGELQVFRAQPAPAAQPEHAA